MNCSHSCLKIYNLVLFLYYSVIGNSVPIKSEPVLLGPEVEHVKTMLPNSWTKIMVLLFRFGDIVIEVESSRDLDTMETEQYEKGMRYP